MAFHLSPLCVLSSLLILVVFFNLSTPATAVVEFSVGDDSGWRVPDVNQTDLYAAWASSKKFHVGDLLRFVYFNDSVVKVDKWGYYHCNFSGPDQTVYIDGNNTLIALEKPGPVHFVSGDPEHCRAGQRLYIDVIPLSPPGGWPAPATAPQPAGPPESSPGMAPGLPPVSHSSSEPAVAVVSWGVVLAASVAALLA